jgi:multiple sugar transport system substrate-binding protein
MKLSIQVENELGAKFGPSPQVPLKGHSKIRAELIKAAEEVQYGRQTPAQAAAAFLEICKSAIA